ncbi:LPS assembly protein LptD [Iodidimonas sp. SYSU 1G8]|uniref:LPS-assembly protein LptD n=1 Tax=Iodidimonas sp. SYSU 1G8 TaxID=3133967 RepID=UPI0031FE8A0E
MAWLDTLRRLAALSAFAGVCGTVLAVPAWAQEAKKAYWAADEIEVDQNSDLLTARGHVEITYDDTNLKADQIVYDRKTDKAVATGNIRLTDKDGNVATGKTLELTGDLKEGTVQGMYVLFREGERLAAVSGRRMGGDTNVLDHAVYTACEICEEQPDRAPVWQIKAVKVVHDEKSRTLTYKNAYLELMGIPIIYTPWLKHPDASVKKASGFLTPDFGQSSILGVTTELPYFWNIAPNQDLTITPLLTTSERAVLKLEYRHRTKTGQYTLDGSGTYVSKRDNDNNEVPGDEFRGHIFGTGQFQIDKDWRWGFDLALASDDTYLRRYDISRADSLINHLYLERFWERSYLHIGAYAFQGLREEDMGGTTPLAIPLIQYSFVGKPGWLGGYFTADASMAMLTRTDSADTGRISIDGRWQVPFTSPLGDMYKLTLGMRADTYYLNDFEEPSADDLVAKPDVLTGKDFEGRYVPYAALEWRYPFIRYAGKSHQIIEPIVTVVSSTTNANNDEIPNEDSQAFDFDTSNLFSIDRFPGDDRWEGGTRVAYGMRFRHYADNGVRASLLVGQSYRLRRDFSLPADSGLRERTSDIVMTAMLSIPRFFDYYHRMRFDDDGLNIVRNEGLVVFGPEKYRFAVGYTDVKRNGFDPTLPDRQEIRTAASIKLTRYWTMNADFAYDFERGGGALTAGGGFTYEDECFRFRLRARRDFTEDRDVRPSTSIGFQLVFKVVSDPATKDVDLQDLPFSPTFGNKPKYYRKTVSGLE